MQPTFLPDDASLVIYEWLTWGKFLILDVAPHATVVSAEVDDSVERVLAALPEHPSVFLFHVNCSVTRNFPLTRTELIDALHRRNVTTLNADVTDISKRAVHCCSSSLGLHSPQARPEGDPEEMIFVKTNWNSAGTSEHQLSGAQRALLGFGKGHPVIRDPQQYTALRRKEIDPAWWSDNDLICETYVTNRENRWYRVFFLLHRICICELLNPETVKKVGGSKVRNVWRMTSREGRLECLDAGHPEEMARGLLRFQKAFGLDFGAVDLVQNDAGDSYIVDVNTTPAFTVTIPGVVDHLRREFDSRS